MMEQYPEIALATGIINLIASIVFLVLLGAVVYSMLKRVRDYRLAGEPLPLLLKRGVVLFGALALIGGEAVVLRVLNVSMPMGSVERLLFVLQADLILLGAMAYYAKVELVDLDDESKR